MTLVVKIDFSDKKETTVENSDTVMRVWEYLWSSIKNEGFPYPGNLNNVG